MKKFLLAIIAFGTVATAQAQKGSILVYGNLGLSSMKDSAENSIMSWNINPGVGFQITDNFTLGLAGGHTVDQSIKVKGDDDRDVTSHNNIGIFARYTRPVGNIFAIYGQFDAGYEFGHETDGGKEIKGSKYSGFGVGITPAIGINVCHGFGLNFAFGGLSFNSMKYDGASNGSSNVNLTFGHQVNIGVSKNFGGGHKAKHTHEPMDETRKLDTKDDDDSAPKKKAKKDDDE